MSARRTGHQGLLTTTALVSALLAMGVPAHAQDLNLSDGNGGAGSDGVGSSSDVDGAPGGVASDTGAGGVGASGSLQITGGGGGDGGAGVYLDLVGNVNVFAGAVLLGGSGGNGGAGVVAGGGGDGGAGVILLRGTLANQGTLQGGNGGTGSVVGSGGIGLIGTGIRINNTGTISGGLSGDGVTQALAMRLSGSNTITNIGTLVGGVEITSGTTTFDLASDQTLANVVSGAGGLIKQGTGTLTLTGVNSYTGDTTIIGGTVVAGNASALGLVTVLPVTFRQTGAVDLAGNGAKLVADFDGAIEGTLTFATDTDATFAAATGRMVTIGDRGFLDGATVRFGTATEAGTIQIGGGGVTTGNVRPAAYSIDGGTVKILFFNSFGSAGRNSGFAVNTGATLDINGGGVSGGVRTATLANLSGLGTVLNSAEATNLTLSNSTFAGTFDTGANGITLTGGIAGSGRLTKRGTGTLTLASTLDTSGFTGGLTLAEGTLSLQGNLASTFGAITTTGSVIDYADGVTNAAPIEIDSDTTQLQVLTGSATQSGAISELNGPRGFEKIGGGTLVVTGDVSATGTVSITEGTLAWGGSQGDPFAPGPSPKFDLVIGNASTTNSATLRLDRSLRLSSLASGAVADGVDFGITFTPETAITVVGSGSTSFAGTISGDAGRNGSLRVENGSLELTGDGSNFVGQLLAGPGGSIALTGVGTSGAGLVAATTGATLSTDGGALARNANLVVQGSATFSGSETVGYLTHTGLITLTGANTVLTLTGERTGLGVTTTTQSKV